MRERTGRFGGKVKHTVEVEFDAFGWEALSESAERQDVSVEELIAHAAMYYLADEDAGRTGHNVLGSAGQAERSGAPPRAGARRRSRPR